MIFLAGNRSLKYNKYLPINRVRNILAIGHVEKTGYCVRESCRVSVVKGELCQPVVFCPLFLASCYFYWIEGGCLGALSLSALRNLSSLNLMEFVSIF